MNRTHNLLTVSTVASALKPGDVVIGSTWCIRGGQLVPLMTRNAVLSNKPADGYKARGYRRIIWKGSGTDVCDHENTEVFEVEVKPGTIPYQPPAELVGWLKSWNTGKV